MRQGKLWIGRYGLLQKISRFWGFEYTQPSEALRIKAGGVTIGRQRGSDAHCFHRRNRFHAQLFAQPGTSLRHHVKKVGLASNHGDVSDRLPGGRVLKAQVETDSRAGLLAESG